MSLKGKAAAIGIGELKPLKDPGEETPLRLMANVAAEAIADANLEKKDIDGFLVGMPFADPGMIYPAAAAERLGINARMLNVVRLDAQVVIVANNECHLRCLLGRETLDAI